MRRRAHRAGSPACCCSRSSRRGDELERIFGFFPGDKLDEAGLPAVAVSRGRPLEARNDERGSAACRDHEHRHASGWRARRSPSATAAPRRRRSAARMRPVRAASTARARSRRGSDRPGLSACSQVSFDQAGDDVRAVAEQLVVREDAHARRRSSARFRSVRGPRAGPRRGPGGQGRMRRLPPRCRRRHGR